MIRFPLICLLALLAGHATCAATISVPSDQPTIQDAINVAVAGDTVSVSPGTYSENIDFVGKAITVESEQGLAVTIIDGGGTDSVVVFQTDEGRNSVLSGFTIRNGINTDGGGILVERTSPTIFNNHVTGNQACRGGGIAVRFSSALVLGNSVVGNSALTCGINASGGGIFVGGAGAAVITENAVVDNQSSNGGGIGMNAAGTPVFRRNIVAGNTANRDGGGFALINASDARVEQNLVYGNAADSGGAFNWRTPSTARGPYLVNNSISGNTSTDRATIFADAYDEDALIVNNVIVAPDGEIAIFCGDFNDLNPPQIESNVVFASNGSPDGGICAGETSMSGNVVGDPLFADANNGDFRLRPGSPAIDAGNDSEAPSTDWLRNPIPVDGNGDMLAVSDIGAHEANAPQADAGLNVTADPGGSVTLDASNSSDPESSIVSYYWVQVGGIPVTLSDVAAAMPTFTAPSTAATLIFDLAVTDDLGFTNTDTVIVTVTAPSPPPPPNSSGGGCTIGTVDNGIDPTLPLLLLGSSLYLLRRRFGACRI